MTEKPPPPEKPEPPPLPKRRVGRPRRLEQDPQLIEDICGLLRQGASIDMACDAVGIGERSFYDWVEEGEADLAAGRSTFEAEFSQATKRARAERDIEALRRVSAGGEGWQGEAWRLERTRRKTFARPAQVELSGPEGGAIKTEVADARAEQFARIAATVGPDASLFLAEMKRWPGSVEEVEAWRSRRAQATAAAEPPPPEP